MTGLQYYCIQGLAEIKTASQRQNYVQKMQDVQVTKSLITYHGTSSSYYHQINHHKWGHGLG